MACIDLLQEACLTTVTSIVRTLSGSTKVSQTDFNNFKCWEKEACLVDFFEPNYIIIYIQQQSVFHAKVVPS